MPSIFLSFEVLKGFVKLFMPATYWGSLSENNFLITSMLSLLFDF
jgi:hypothetical protein